MPPLADQLIARALRELAGGPKDGLAISDLLQSLDKHAISSEPLDGPARSLFWEALIGRDDVDFGEGASGDALKKLSLDDIVGLGLDGRILKLRAPAEPGLEAVPEPDQDDAPATQTIEAAAPSSEDAVVPKEPSPAPPPAPTSTPKPKRRGRPPGRTSLSKKRVPGTQPPAEERPSSPQVDTSQPESTPQPGTSVSGSRPGTPLATTPAEARPSPRRAAQRISAPSTKLPRMSLGAGIKKAKFTPHDEVQREEDDAKIGAGIPGVYINPTVALLPELQQGKNIKKRVIAVFKSTKLKIPQWLAARRGTWREEFVKRTQKDPESILHPVKENVVPAHRTPSGKRKEAPQPPGQPSSTGSPATVPVQALALQTPPPLAQPLGHPPNIHAHVLPSQAPPPAQSPNNTSQQPSFHAGPSPSTHGYANQGPAPAYQNGTQPSTPSFGQQMPPRPIPRHLMPPQPQSTYQSPYKSPYGPGPSPALQSVLAPAPSPVPAPVPASVPGPVSVPAPIQTSAPAPTPIQAPGPVQAPPIQAASPVPAPAPTPAPSYRSPYQSPYQSTYQSPYQSPYQSIAAPASQTQPQPLPSTLAPPTAPVALNLQPPVDPQKKGKRKASVDGDGRPEKRRKSISKPVQTLPLPVNAPLPPPVIPVPQLDPALEAILKQQEEEKAKEAQKERELQEKLSNAELVEVPEHLVRLAAAYDDTVGNLILSRNQATLSFMSVEEPAGTPILVIPVSTIRDNPIVSIAGSKPMELRVRSKDDADVETLHSFNIGLTQAARKAADVMRSKLVLARISARATGDQSSESSEGEVDETKLAIRKPFLCEKCGKRFKNREGIIYHSTRSQTTCNPSFDPSTVQPRVVRVSKKKKKKEKKEKKVKIVEPPQPALPVDTAEAGDAEKAGEEEPESDSSDSLGSIIEWAEKVSRTKGRYTSSRRRRGNEPSSNQSDEEGASALVRSGDEGSDPAALFSEEDEYESMDDDFYNPGKEKTPRHSASQRAMQERWARAKAVGANKLTGDADLEELQARLYQSSPRNVPKRPRATTLDEGRRRIAQSAARKLQCWDSARPLLQNTETGAWDQTAKRVPRKHQRRYELPEPVTYMQESNGAWSIRPFGHGVKPVYARPSRRADGNPFLPAYLKRLENGFRPVVMPTKNRLFLPATPAKRLLEDPSSYTPPSSVDDLGASAKRRKLDSGERISKATGRPVRAYRKPGSAFGGPVADYLDQIHVLNSLEPKKLDPAEGRRLNPGLETLPADFGLGREQSPPDQVWDEGSRRLREEIPVTFSLRDIVEDTGGSQPLVLSGIEQVAEWEQGRGSDMLNNGSLQPEFRWLNHTLESLEGSTDLQHVKFAWDDNRSFDILTLPYSELDEIEDNPLFDAPSSYRMPRSALKPASRNARDHRELRKGWTTRRLTALESDLAGLGADPELIAREMNTQIAPPDMVQRTRHADSQMSAAEDQRLIVSVCVIRTLTGGLDQNIDWVLVSQMFRSFSMNFLNKRWAALQQKKKVVIEKLVADFQDAFLVAYKNGDVPPLDYDNLVAYDWSRLVDWAMRTLDVGLGNKAIQLPETRERLDKLYNIKELNTDNSRQEGYFSLTYPVYKRMELASSVPNTMPAFPKPSAKCAEDITIDTLTVVKSWVRAAALTPDEEWNPQIIKRMFKTLNDPHREDKRGNDPVVKKLVDRAAEVLKDEKVLMQKNRGRATPDRSFEPTDVFFSCLRKTVTVQQVVQAARFKRHLDQAFASGVTCIRSDYLADEGTLMAVTQLQAHGRIRLQPVGVPSDKFGLGGGSYETRKIPKERFRFDMDIYPTKTYLQNADIAVLQKLRQTEPPRGSAAGELPVWYGIGDRLIVSLWHRVVVAFAGTIALRAGSGIDGLKKIFKPTLEEWEIWRLLEWGGEHGVFERLHPIVGGWTTGEWWWLVVGWCCAGGE